MRRIATEPEDPGRAGRAPVPSAGRTGAEADERVHRAALLRPVDMERRILELGPAPRACLLCGASDQRKSFFRFGKWFWRCPACDLVYVHDVYPEFSDDVAPLDGIYELRRAVPAPPRIRRMARSIADELRERRGAAGRFLEVGCGQGQFLEHVAAAGWDVTGVDILPEAARIAREERGLDVRAGELFDAAFDDESFDAVFMSEVIEHVVDPIELMREVRRVLRPGGVAVLRTGNARSWSARLRGGDWAYYKFGGHLHIRFYSPRAARALGRAAGFDRVESRTSGFAFREAGEVQGRWYRPLLQIAQVPVSSLAGTFGAGHRLRMTLFRDG